jgi:hypothetical protein
MKSRINAMTRKIWLRCLLVSFVASLVVPPITMFTFAPAEGEEVVDLRAIDPEKMSQLSGQEFDKYVQSIPTRRLEGWERITYGFTHPQWLLFYWRAVLSWFLIIFASTVVVSYWNETDR